MWHNLLPYMPHRPNPYIAGQYLVPNAWGVVEVVDVMSREGYKGYVLVLDLCTSY